MHTMLNTAHFLLSWAKFIEQISLLTVNISHRVSLNRGERKGGKEWVKEREEHVARCPFVLVQLFNRVINTWRCQELCDGVSARPRGCRTFTRRIDTTDRAATAAHLAGREHDGAWAPTPSQRAGRMDTTSMYAWTCKGKRVYSQHIQRKTTTPHANA